MTGWVCLLALLASSPAMAAATEWVGDADTAVRLVTASDTAGTDGPVEAGLEFRYGAGRHGSWRNPGDAGLAPKVDWSGSDGVGAAHLAFPAPSRFSVGDLQTYVYAGHVVLPVTLARTGSGPLHLHATVRHAVCGEVCVPYRASLDLTLPAGPAARAKEADLIAAGRAAVPTSPAAAGLAVTQATRVGPGLLLTLGLRSETVPFERPDLFIEGLAHGATPPPTVTLADAGHAATLTVRVPPESGAIAAPLTLTLVDGARAASFAFDRAATPDGPGLLAILGIALLGGLILNLMPCVLPVLSLKVFAITRHAREGTRAIRAGLAATAAGIVASFLAIAAALCLLRASGAGIGWGIQFQQPWFLAGMAALTVVFAASLFEWTTIGLPGRLAQVGTTRGRGPLSEAFLTGAFATLLATPCSAPFVGTAVGFALTQGAPTILATFAALGLGMALPYLAIAIRPGLVQALPRPGPWMNRLRLGLGLLLLATAAWLIFVLAQVIGAGQAALVVLALGVLLGWLALNRHGTPRRRTHWITGAIALAAVAGASLPAVAPDSVSGQEFDPGRIPNLVAEGRVVLVDVTAAWCLTCKINDAVAFARAPVRERLAGPDVVRMRADWTSPDPTILAYLQSFGRSGIPLVVVYGRGRPEGEALPELLSPGLVLAGIARAEASDGERPVADGKSPAAP
jgi:suppressor for copper-sensitivity B